MERGGTGGKIEQREDQGKRRWCVKERCVGFPRGDLGSTMRFGCVPTILVRAEMCAAGVVVVHPRWSEGVAQLVEQRPFKP